MTYDMDQRMAHARISVHTWCAAEAGVEPTASPTICPRHEAMLLQQQEVRQAARRAKSEDKTSKQQHAA